MPLAAVELRYPLSERARWPAGPDRPTLSQNRVHVWRADLDREPRYETMFALLSPDERDRSSRFRLERDRRRFVHGRAILRLLLGRYLDQSPAQIELRRSGHGKPELAEPAAACRFNVSRAGATALFALTCGREIGVDVERVRWHGDHMTLARRFFARHEVRALEALPAMQRPRAFAVCWTRKEAFVKARGAGLSFRLDRFSVSTDPDAPALLEVVGEPDEARRWTLINLPVGDSLAGALAFRGAPCPVELWRWTGGPDD